jgi:RluA family pseudouridine synthase
MLNFIHQDKHLLVLNKPAGLSVLPEGWEPSAPYVRRMLENRFGRIWVVHRLDKGTSGVMIFAKTAEAHRHLNAQFERHTVEKVYWAVVEGAPEWNQYTARHALHANVGRRHRTVVDQKRGKRAETAFRVLKRGQSQSLLAAHPKTGRTHQIRVHLAALGFPIVGDGLYGAMESDRITRPALHARKLTFQHPKTGETVSFEAPLPEDMTLLIERLSL